MLSSLIPTDVIESSKRYTLASDQDTHAPALTPAYVTADSGIPCATAAQVRAWALERAATDPNGTWSEPLTEAWQDTEGSLAADAPADDVAAWPVLLWGDSVLFPAVPVGGGSTGAAPLADDDWSTVYQLSGFDWA